MTASCSSVAFCHCREVAGVAVAGPPWDDLSRPVLPAERAVPAQSTSDEPALVLQQTAVVCQEALELLTSLEGVGRGGCLPHSKLKSLGGCG